MAIVGGGPAGISAAIQSARLGLSSAIIEKDHLGGTARIAPRVENYAGFCEAIEGSQLMRLFCAQLHKWPVSILKGNAQALAREEDGAYSVQCESFSIKADSVIVATGLVPVKAQVEGEIPYGSPQFVEHSGKRVLVIGGGDCAFDLASAFAEKAEKVTVCMRSKKPRAAQILVERATSAGVKVICKEDWQDIPRDVLITCCGRTAAYDFIQKLVRDFDIKELSRGKIFFAGDIAHPEIRHIAAAVGDGVAVAESAYGRIHGNLKNKRRP